MVNQQHLVLSTAQKPVSYTHLDVYKRQGYDVKKKSKGIGMKNMVDRTHESDGTIEIKSEKDKGTQVLVVVPLEHKTIKV